MNTLHNKTYPNENQDYRVARNELLLAEKKLRLLNTEVTTLRSKLPLGGKLKEDYLFEEIKDGTIVQAPFSSLFQDSKNSLIIYSMMYPNHEGKPCPACTSILDGLNGSSPHVNDRTNFVVVGKAPVQDLQVWAKKRGWNNLRILSSGGNTFNKDYFTEDSKGNQQPLVNVFQKTPEGIFHFYGTELFYIAPETGQDMRHVDALWPIWNLFDLTPEGRGTWFPKYSYPKKKINNE